MCISEYKTLHPTKFYKSARMMSWAINDGQPNKQNVFFSSSLDVVVVFAFIWQTLGKCPIQSWSGAKECATIGHDFRI